MLTYIDLSSRLDLDFDAVEVCAVEADPETKQQTSQSRICDAYDELFAASPLAYVVMPCIFALPNVGLK